jgi:hypothetical protein
MVQFMTLIRRCSAAVMNKLMQDPEAVKTFGQEVPPTKLVYHPAAGEFLERKRKTSGPPVSMSG